MISAGRGASQDHGLQTTAAGRRETHLRQEGKEVVLFLPPGFVTTVPPQPSSLPDLGLTRWAGGRSTEALPGPSRNLSN